MVADNDRTERWFEKNRLPVNLQWRNLQHLSEEIRTKEDYE